MNEIPQSAESEASDIQLCRCTCPTEFKPRTCGGETPEST